MTDIPITERIEQRLDRGEPMIYDDWHDGSEGDDRALLEEAGATVTAYAREAYRNSEELKDAQRELKILKRQNETLAAELQTGLDKMIFFKEDEETGLPVYELYAFGYGVAILDAIKVLRGKL